MALFCFLATLGRVGRITNITGVLFYRGPILSTFDLQIREK
jgi:hypothetical protein